MGHTFVYGMWNKLIVSNMFSILNGCSKGNKSSITRLPNDQCQGTLVASRDFTSDATACSTFDSSDAYTFSNIEIVNTGPSIPYISTDQYNAWVAGSNHCKFATSTRRILRPPFVRRSHRSLLDIAWADLDHAPVYSGCNPGPVRLESAPRGISPTRSSPRAAPKREEQRGWACDPDTGLLTSFSPALFAFHNSPVVRSQLNGNQGSFSNSDDVDMQNELAMMAFCKRLDPKMTECHRDHSKPHFKLIHGISALKLRKKVHAHLCRGMSLSDNEWNTWFAHPNIFRCPLDPIKNCAKCHGQDDIARTSGEAKNPGPGPKNPGPGPKKPMDKHKPVETGPKPKKVASKKSKSKVNTPVGKRKATIPGVNRANPIDVGVERMFRGVDETAKTFESPIWKYSTLQPTVFLPISLQAIATMITNYGAPIPNDLSSLLTEYADLLWGRVTFRLETQLSSFKGGSVGMVYVPIDSSTQPSGSNVNSILDTSMLVKRRDHRIIPVKTRIASFELPRIGGSRTIHGPDSLLGHLCVFQREPITQANTGADASSTNSDSPYLGDVGTIHIKFEGLGQYRTFVSDTANQLFSAVEYPLVNTPNNIYTYATDVGADANMAVMNPLLPPQLARAISNNQMLQASTTPKAVITKLVGGVTQEYTLPLILIPILETLAAGFGIPPGVATLVAKGVEGIVNIAEYVAGQFREKVYAIQVANDQATSGVIGGVTTGSGFVTSCNVVDSRSDPTWTRAFWLMLQAFNADPGTKPLRDTIVTNAGDESTWALGCSWPAVEGETNTLVEDVLATVYESDDTGFPTVKTIASPRSLGTGGAVAPLNDYLFGLPWRTVPASTEPHWAPVPTTSSAGSSSESKTRESLFLVSFQAAKRFPKVSAGDHDSYETAFAAATNWQSGITFVFTKLSGVFTPVTGSITHPQHAIQTTTRDAVADYLRIARWTTEGATSTATVTFSYRTVGTCTAPSPGHEFLEVESYPWGDNPDEPNPQGVATCLVVMEGDDCTITPLEELMLLRSDNTFELMNTVTSIPVVYEILVDF